MVTDRYDTTASNTMDISNLNKLLEDIDGTVRAAHDGRGRVSLSLVSCVRFRWPTDRGVRRAENWHDEGGCRSELTRIACVQVLDQVELKEALAFLDPSSTGKLAFEPFRKFWQGDN